MFRLLRGMEGDDGEGSCAVESWSLTMGCLNVYIGEENQHTLNRAGIYAIEVELDSTAAFPL